MRPRTVQFDDDRLRSVVTRLGTIAVVLLLTVSLAAGFAVAHPDEKDDADADADEEDELRQLVVVSSPDTDELLEYTFEVTGDGAAVEELEPDEDSGVAVDEVTEIDDGFRVEGAVSTGDDRFEIVGDLDPVDVPDGVEIEVTPLESEAAADDGDAAEFYQVDFVAGGPIEQFGDSPDSDDFYSHQSRLIHFMHGSQDDPVKRIGYGTDTLDEDVEVCITESELTADGEEATLEFTVADGCEVELSLVSYSKPTDDWSFEEAAEQELLDVETDTFGPGTHTITVDLAS